MDFQVTMDSIDKEAEYNYTPSKFVKDFPPETAVATYIKQYEDETNAVRKLSTHDLDIPYGTERECKLDLYTNSKEPTPENAPVFIWIHGGYWQIKEANKENHGLAAFPVIQAKAIAAVIDYQLAPEATLDEMASQISSAVKFIKKRFPKSKLFLSGHSAGGHLAAMMFTLSHWQDIDLYISGAVLISGLYDLTPLLQTSMNIALQMDKDIAERNSPTLLLKERKPAFDCPVILAFGEFDPPCFHQQSMDFAKVLESHGITTKCIQVPNTDHFSVVSKLFDEEFSISQEIVQMMTESSNRPVSKGAFDRLSLNSE